MAAVLHVYKEVEILNEGLLRGEIREPGTVTVSYDEKPGIQALAQKTPDRGPYPGSSHPTRTTNTNGWEPFRCCGAGSAPTVTEIVSERIKARTSLAPEKLMQPIRPRRCD